MKAEIIFAAVAFAAAATTSAVAPTIRAHSVTFDQNANRLVTIKYVLDDAPGIVTLDIETNRTGAATNSDADWVSIGGENIQNLSGGAVNCLVDSLGENRIYWKADRSWPDHKVRSDAVRARVTAWSTNTPPNYLVVDLTGEEAPAYYTDAAFLPNGGLTNNCYRERYMVMRKIPAAGVKWKMGAPEGEHSRSADEVQHYVVLSNDYYMAVFPVTVGQYKECPASSSYAHGGYGAFNDTYTNGCPRSLTAWKGMIRGYHNKVCWPEDRHKVDTGTFLANLRSRTDIDFDLPTEAQWEFACRAGCGATCYTGESPTTETGMIAALSKVAWYDGNSDRVSWKTSSAKNGRAKGYRVVGQLIPNDWGLYDMCGNILEECLDWYGPYTNGVDSVYYEPEGISTAAMTERTGVGINQTSKSTEDNYRVFRGGRYAGSYPGVRPAERWQGAASGGLSGARLMCPVTLKFPDSEK